MTRQIPIPHQKIPFDVVSIDDFCLIQASLQWFQSDDFLSPAFSPHLLDGIGVLIQARDHFVSCLFIYRLIIDTHS